MSYYLQSITYNFPKYTTISAFLAEKSICTSDHIVNWFKNAEKGKVNYIDNKKNNNKGRFLYNALILNTKISDDLYHNIINNYQNGYLILYDIVKAIYSDVHKKNYLPEYITKKFIQEEICCKNIFNSNGEHILENRKNPNFIKSINKD